MGKYAALKAMGTFMILNPKKAQTTPALMVTDYLQKQNGKPNVEVGPAAIQQGHLVHP